MQQEFAENIPNELSSSRTHPYPPEREALTPHKTSNPHLVFEKNYPKNIFITLI